jgi:hypothetical protein
MFAITSPTSDSRSVGIVRLQTETMEFSLVIYRLTDWLKRTVQFWNHSVPELQVWLLIRMLILSASAIKPASINKDEKRRSYGDTLPFQMESMAPIVSLFS